jgi:putative ABC transport system permease protein
MLKNYLSIAFRNLRRYPVYGLINGMSLVIGLTCCILVYLYVEDELRYDSHQVDLDRIHKIQRVRTLDDGKRHVSGPSGGFRGAVENELPEVVRSARIISQWMNVRGGEKEVSKLWSIVDPDFLDMFTFPLVDGGNGRSILEQPESVLITETTARALFGEQDPIGQVVTTIHQFIHGDYVIRGVLKDVPEHSSFRFHFLTSSMKPNVREGLWSGWFGLEAWRPIRTFVQLPQEIDLAQFDEKLTSLPHRHVPEGQADGVMLHAQPFSRVHLYSRSDYGFSGNIHSGESAKPGIEQVYFLSAIAAFILLMAGANFVNLSTARATDRHREIGVRKAIGATRRQVARQFLVESLLVALFAFAFSVLLTDVVLDEFNSFTRKHLVLSVDALLGILPVLLPFTLLVGLLAGAYPSCHLARVRPVNALKGDSDGSRSRLRQGLVIFQFAATVVLLVGAITVGRQVHFALDRDPGFNPSGVLNTGLYIAEDGMIEDAAYRRSPERYESRKQAFLAHPDVISATAYRTALNRLTSQPVSVEGEPPESRRMHFIEADHGFLSTMEIELVAGRNLSGDIPSDRTDAFILNETAVRTLGWTDPIGKQFQIDSREGRVIGVIKDFHFQSLRQPIGPLVISYGVGFHNFLALRLRPEGREETIAAVREIRKQYLPDRVFRVQFLDQILDHWYDADRRFARIFRMYSVLAVSIGCLGLVGLSVYSAQKRSKEIGVRKVLGGSVRDILVLFTGDYSRLLIVANIVAWPVSYLLLRGWLDEFAVRIDFSVWILLQAGLLAAGFAAVAVGYQSTRAALADPVRALRFE